MRENQNEQELVFEGMVSLRALIDAAKSGKNARKIERVLYAPERREKHPKEYLFLAHRAEELGFALELRSASEIGNLASGGSHGGVIALCGPRTLPEITAEDLPENGFFMMTEGIEDPYNFGYMLRSIYASGADGVILTGKERTGADGTICRSSAGASERMALYTGDPCRCADLFHAAGYTVAASDTINARSIYDVGMKRPLIMIVGGEKRGISSALLKKCDLTVKLDYGRDFDAALSAASAASIIAFEIFRQNRNG